MSVQIKLLRRIYHKQLTCFWKLKQHNECTFLQ